MSSLAFVCPEIVLPKIMHQLGADINSSTINVLSLVSGEHQKA